MRRSLLLVLLSISSILVCSCVSHDSYPDEREKLQSIKNDPCPDISGIYENHHRDHDNLSVTLGEILWGAGWKEDYDLWGEYIEIEQHGEDNLIIRIIRSNFEVLKEIILSQESGGYKCNPEGFVFKEESGIFADVGQGAASAGVGSEIYFLRKAKDKSLIASHKGVIGGGGVWFYVPLTVSGSDSSWIRFLPPGIDMENIPMPEACRDCFPCARRSKIDSFVILRARPSHKAEIEQEINEGLSCFTRIKVEGEWILTRAFDERGANHLGWNHVSKGKDIEYCQCE